MKSETFFVNVFSRNDRKVIDFDYIENAKEIITTDSEKYFDFTLFTVGDKRIDPWVMAQFCISESQGINPLVAVNPFYQHPVNIAKKMASWSVLYPQKKLAINLVTGSFFNELRALNDNLNQEERFLRLKDFYFALDALLSENCGKFESNYYQINSADFFPKVNNKDIYYFFSGALYKDFSNHKNIYFVQSMRPLDQMEKINQGHFGLAVGICARETDAEANLALKELYPENRQGKMLFEMSLANNLTAWNLWLKSFLKNGIFESLNFNLIPMMNSWSSNPFLVGSYEAVAGMLKSYEKFGYHFFILDYDKSETAHVKKCIDIFRM